MIKIMRKLLAIVFVFVSLYSNSQSMCGGSSATLQALNPQNLAGPTYSLNPGGFSSIGGVFVVSPNTTTQYTLYTTGQNTANVVVTTSAVTIVTVNPQPNVAPTLTQASCTSSLNAVNLGLTFNPGSPVPSYTITWNPIPASVLSPQQTTATTLSPGPYTISVVAAGGCSTVVNFSANPQPAPATFSVNPFGGTHSITCIQPTVVLNATNPNLTYTWSSTSTTPVISPSVTLNATNLGTTYVTGQNPSSGCTTTYSFLIAQNVAVPSSSISATSVSISCSQTAAPTISVTSNPTVNISHYIYSPQGGTFAANSYTAIYSVGGPGTYTHDLVDNASGCFTRKTFTVTSSTGYPTYSVSSPQNFTVGCGSTASAVVNIIGANTNPPGGTLTYTLLAPSPLVVPPFSTSLSILSSYTVTVPGTWTVIAKDFVNNCETRTPVSILQNIFTPSISAVVPRQILDCDNPSTVLQGVSETANVSYNWGFAGTPGNVPGTTITVNTNLANTTQTLVNNFTLTITDNNNTCKSTSVIPIYQNIFPPKIAISAGNASLSCIVTTVQLTNQSSTGILGSYFPTNLPVIGYLWEGPTPQEPLQVSSTYLAGTVGTYTMTGKDRNNGCLATGTIAIGDNRIYPFVNAPPTVATPSVIDCGQGSVKLIPVVSPSANITFSWTAPNNGIPPVVGDASLAAYPVKFPGTYTVLVTNTISGCATRTTMSAVNATLTAEFEPSVTEGYAPLEVSFTNKSSSSNSVTGTASITSMWSFGNGTNTVTYSASDIAKTIFKQPGTYTITMFAVKGPCLDTAVHTIKVEVPSELEVPNVFTPNDDKVNDFFFLKATNLTEINMQIWDRWGHLVYELITEKGNVEWDGKNQYGKECADGTYFYVLNAKGKDGQDYKKKGTISLYR